MPDRKDGKRGGASQQWFDGVAAALCALPGIIAAAEAAGTAVSVGLLTRRAKGGGRAADALAGRVAWADIDFKEVAEADARAKLDGGGVPFPSLLVRSGHGLHAYWLLDGETAPADIVAINRKLAFALSADRCHDAARVLRLPGSLNLKECWAGGTYTFDADKAKVCTLERMDAVQRFPAASFAALPDPPVVGGSRTVTTRATGRIGDLPPQVRELIHIDPRLSALWRSRGKADGDVSNSGYDASFALVLARKGILDPDVLDAAVAARPVTGDTAARTARAIRRTVDWALSKVKDERATVLAQDTFLPLLVAVEKGRKPRVLLADALRIGASCFTAPQRMRLGELAGGELRGTMVHGARCPVCGEARLSWPAHPWRGPPAALCEGCAWGGSLKEVVRLLSIDPLAVVSPGLAGGG